MKNYSKISKVRRALFHNFLKKIYLTLIDNKEESVRLLDMILENAGKKLVILDVGCGYGRNMELLKAAGISDITGVEKNKQIQEVVLGKGFKCQDQDQFNNSSKIYDVILMSHLIEHFDPVNLLYFIDGYLERLAPDGLLVIATPLLSNYFYDDFDHIKPYLPTGILNVFGGKNSQVQFYSKNKLELVDLWFRRDYYKFKFHKSLYINTNFTPFVRILNLLSALLFRASFRVFGRADGWIGVFRKSKLQKAEEVC